MKQDMIVILDLGSEENPRLAREIRALGVYSEIHPHDITLEELKALAAESRLEYVLSGIEGVGRVSVLCSEEGAAVVCDGAGDAAVRLAVVQAVSNYTGLGSSRITVLPMQSD